MLYGVTDAKPSKDMHHIHSIRSAPQLRMQRSNWIAVCGPCHEDLEGDAMEGMKVKQWSERAYNAVLEASAGLKPGVSEKTGLTVADRSHTLSAVSPKMGVFNG
jgi:hypothetical protein